MPHGPTDLLDVNVWLSLADADHVHHPRARQYWETESHDRIAFCRGSMLRFLRLCTNGKVMHGHPFAPDEAWQAYRSFRALPEVLFLAEPPEVEAQMVVWSDRATFPATRWTDCYLASLAASTVARLVSFDHDFRNFNGLDFLHLAP